ncbi:MAG: MATE family efflux transporter [Halobacteriaceae archaeon]
MSAIPNPVRLTLLAIGYALARVDLVSEERIRRTVDLSWPRIVTGIARMSKNAVDVAMVGTAVGGAAIGGVGLAGPYWGLAFALGGGIAAGTIALVSQRYGAEAYGELAQAIRSSVLLVVVLTLPLAALFWFLPEELIGLLTDDAATIRHGAAYLKIVGLGVPFAGLNLIGSRIFIGADDAWTPMVVRAGGAATNIGLNAVFIFGLGMGAAGAALGTVLSNAMATGVFAVLLSVRRLPGTRGFPATVSPFGSYVHRETLADLVRISLPVIGRNATWTVARFPLLAIVAMFGPKILAAYIVARRIRGLLNTPGWGFGLAASSLVGQELGAGDEEGAEQYGHEIVRYSVATYLVAAAIVLVFTEPIVHLFVDDPGEIDVLAAIWLVYAACASVVGQGVTSAAAGALDASGDTRWPFYSQALGMFGGVLPLAYLGATTSLGLLGLGLTFFAESGVPAAINYYRFSTGKWKSISREFRPDVAADD